MPDFSRPEYASYRELAREVAVERTPQDGDYYVEFCGDRKPIVKGPIAPLGWKVSTWPDVQDHGCSFYWLPALADWLEMLKALGVGQPYSHIHIEYLPGSSEDREEISISTRGVVGLGLTEEEATARLHQAVKG